MSSTVINAVLSARSVLEQRFDRLLADNGPALARLAGSYTNSVSDRDDLLQDIAMAVWQALPRFRGECSERTFLFRIAHNRAIAHLSRSRSRGEVDEEVELPDPRPTPEAGLVREQQGERLSQAVRALPVLYRQVVMLALEGLEYSEIAQILGISESNVGVRLNRAKQMLRKLLEDMQ
jgi:RNA polymerase sigma-70 factor (ECF subfamily)